MKAHISIPFRADIEGLRGLAVLLVVAYHCGVPLAAGGYVGVDVFFALSGYLITAILVQEAELTGTVNLVEFYARRCRRILPAAAVVLLATVALGAAILPPIDQARHARVARSAALYVSNLRFGGGTNYFAAGAETSPFLHTWSLAVEEQFYLVWPLLAYACWRIGSGSRRRAVWVLAGAGAGSFAWAVLLVSRGDPWGFFAMPPRAWEFAAGALALWLPAEGLRRNPGRAAALGGLGLAAIAGGAVLFTQATPFPGFAALPPVLGTVAVLASGAAAPAGWPSRVLGSVPLRWLGRRSYSWYLWHWPVLVLAVAVFPGLSLAARIACGALALGLSDASYRWVERPARQSPWLGPRPWATLAFAAALTLTCFVTAKVWTRYAGWARGAPEQQAIAAALAHHKQRMRACGSRFGDATVKECWYGEPGGPRVVLFGDSHAAHWFSAFQSAAVERGWRVGLIWKAGCPTPRAPIYLPAYRRAEPECARWREATLKRIRQLQPDLVILTSATMYVQGPRTVQSTARLAPAQWGAGLRRTLLALDSAGVRAVLLRDTPLPGFHVPGCVSQSRYWGAGGDTRCSVNRQEAVDGTIWEAERRAAAGLARTRTVDLTDAFCTATRCPPMIGGDIVYADGNHLMARFAARLGPVVVRALPEVGGAATPAGAGRVSSP
jgi:peptidoglycan/LPS O-acetylase OafA/YrhL